MVTLLRKRDRGLGNGPALAAEFDAKGFFAPSTHVAIVNKAFNLSASLYEIRQILSLTIFERTSLDLPLTLPAPQSINVASANQLKLFE